MKKHKLFFVAIALIFMATGGFAQDRRDQDSCRKKADDMKLRCLTQVTDNADIALCFQLVEDTKKACLRDVKKDSPFDDEKCGDGFTRKI